MTTHIDTVEHATATPDVELPFAELGLKDDEYARIREILGRRPTSCELAMYSVMWSEHCSYKSSRKHLRQFGEKVPPQAKDILLVGMGENAGVVDVGQGFAVTFKAESHNHPSYIEPYQGKGPAGFFGMIAHIDKRFGDLDKFLADEKLRENTIVIFMTDNGGTSGVQTFNAGLRAGKTTYYDGGHRVPCWIRWPAGKLGPARDIDTPGDLP